MKIAIAFRRRFIAFAISVFILFVLSSCYSARIVNKDGIPEPDPTNNKPGFYKQKKMHVLDTTISLKFWEGDYYLIAKECTSGGFYSFEYRVTFGGLLLNAITLGRKKNS